MREKLVIYTYNEVLTYLHLMLTTKCSCFILNSYSVKLIWNKQTIIIKIRQIKQNLYEDSGIFITLYTDFSRETLLFL